MLAERCISTLVVWAGALAWHDFRDHRLPDVLTLPAIPVALALLLMTRPENAGFGTFAAVVVMGLGFVAHRAVDLGLGDVKLLPSVALIVANSPHPLEKLGTGLGAIAILGGIHAAIHLAITRDRKAHIPFGPSILGGLMLTLLAG